MKRPIRSPELVELRAFCIAADLGSLSKAAQMLNISQPALSKRLQVLETLAGKRLLERSSRGVSLTASGNRLYIEARKLLAQAETIEEMMGASAPVAPIRLAASHTVAEFVLPELLVEFESQQDHHLSVELVIGNSDLARRLVFDRDSELGIVGMTLGDVPPADDLTEIPFLDDEIVVVVPRTHRWARLKQIPLEQFLQTPLILRDPGADSRHTVEHVLDEHNLSLATPVAEIGSTSAIASAAIAQNLPALLSSLAVRGEELLIRRVEGLQFTRRFVMVLGSAEENLLTPTRTLVRYLLDRRPIAVDSLV